jgi:probable rRNA maturation factor
MSVDVENESGRVIDGEAISRIVRVVLADHDAADADVAVLLVSDERIRELNGAYRDVDEVTDVLAFPIDDTDALVGVPRLLGDVVIAVDQAERQAAAAHQPAGQELATLIVHGTLHLLGYDHETDHGEMLATQHAVLQRVADVPWPA